MFKEVRYNPGQTILREGNLVNGEFYIIAEGLVRIYATNNPFRRKDYNKQGMLKNTKLD
jgi:CRP-like cAMP-binding protein